MISPFVAASVIAGFEYAQNAQLLAENQRLKKELSDSSQRLLALQAQLNQTQAEVAKLQADMARLEEQLRIAGSITVGLTFLWTGGTANIAWFNVSDLEDVVQHMNDLQWANTKVYFFIRHAGPVDFMPENGGCAALNWFTCDGSECRQLTPLEIEGSEAWDLYAEKDIPVGVYHSVGTDEIGSPLSGCVWESKKPERTYIAAAFCVV
jgi:hypothetical protein